MSDLFRSRWAQMLLAVVGLLLFYALGVIVRRHSGVCIIIRNESNDTVRELSVTVGDQGEPRKLKDLARDDQERVYVKPVEGSPIVLGFTEGSHAPYTVNVFDQAAPGDCGSATVRLQPRGNTETVEAQPDSWKSWLDFL